MNGRFDNLRDGDLANQRPLRRRGLPYVLMAAVFLMAAVIGRSEMQRCDVPCEWVGLGAYLQAVQ